jgi:hypothetical protein
MTRERRAWLAGQALPETAREQVTVAIAMIDALEVQIAPIDRELRAYARRQPGCRALMTHYWWVLLVAGIAWVAVALVILQFDHASVTTVGILVGFMFLAVGIENIAHPRSPARSSCSAPRSSRPRCSATCGARRPRP